MLKLTWNIFILSFGWDFKPSSWLSVVIKNPMALFVKSRGVTPVTPGQIPTPGPYQSWPPNKPHPLDWLYDSLSSPPVAGVWWAHWRRCPVAAVASSKWRGETPHMIVKRFGCTTIHNKAHYKCIIHSYCPHPLVSRADLGKLDFRVGLNENANSFLPL